MNSTEPRTAESDLEILECDSDERSLIEAAKTQPASFAELYEQNFARVYTFFARRVGTRDEAQDLTAEVFHQALASIRSFKWQGAPFVAWLYGIATNVLARHWQKIGKISAEQLTDIADAGDEIERSVALAQAVNSLLPDQRHVVISRFVDQKSIREIAQQLGRSEGAIKQLQLRAIENLRARLGDNV
jgi:RNA polymerase sigma-70 factor, ECF subfamily